MVACAADEERAIISADTDFGAILSQSGEQAPSVVLFRRVGRTPEAQHAVLRANLPAVEGDLAAGALVVFDQDTVRIRRLPIDG